MNTFNSDQIIFTFVEGFLGYFDILGFSELLRSQEAEAFEKKFENYCEILNDAPSREERNLDYTFFSDSVIINTQSGELCQLLNIARAISEITYRLIMELDVTICGCIAFGKFTKRRDNGNAMMTGTPIFEAIHYEKKQNWIGTMLSPSVLLNFRELNDILKIESEGPDVVGKICENVSWLTTLQNYRGIPFPGGTYEGYVIVPRNRKSNQIQAINQDYQLYINKLRELALCAPDDLAQYKYELTGRFIKEIVQRWARKIRSSAYKKLIGMNIE